MDLLTHLFLPLTVAYVLRREVFDRPRYLVLGAFGVLPDIDKVLGQPGLFHSLVTLVPFGIGLLVVEYAYRGSLELAPVAALLTWSHLLLDLVDGGPVPLLFPFAKTGIGFVYPLQVTFGRGLLGVAIHGSPIGVRTVAPEPGFNTYGLVNGFGVLSAITFAVLLVGLMRKAKRERHEYD